MKNGHPALRGMAEFREERIWPDGKMRAPGREGGHAARLTTDG
jgi:hypothetical protein